MDQVTTKKFFQARDEIIDSKDDVKDYWDGELMKESVMDRLSNALKLLDEVRSDLGIADRDHVPESY
jgi:hypothetical protein